MVFIASRSVVINGTVHGRLIHVGIEMNFKVNSDVIELKDLERLWWWNCCGKLVSPKKLA